jgi:hypothetical protein
MSGESGRTREFHEGDQVSYVSVHSVRVWWLRDTEGKWWPSDYEQRQGTATDNDVRDLLYAREHQGRGDIEWKPAPENADRGEVNAWDIFALGVFLTAGLVVLSLTAMAVLA